MAARTPNKSMSEEIVEMLRGEISSQISSTLKGELTSGISLAVKGEIAVLSERMDGQKIFLEEKFRHIEQRQGDEARSIGVRLDRDSNEIKSLAEDVKGIKGDISNLRTEISKSSGSGEKIEKLESRIDTLEAKMENRVNVLETGRMAALETKFETRITSIEKEQIKPLQDERLEMQGMKKTLGWLWGAFGAAIVAGLGTGIYLLIKLA